MGEGACQPDIFTKYRLGCELSYGTCPISLCALYVWERMGEKYLAQLIGEGACQPDIFTTHRLGCELSYGTCPVSLCAL